jgi:hypothetical protein
MPIQTKIIAMRHRIVSELRTNGFEHVRWRETPKGVRANRKGKVSIPSEYTKNRVCVAHGNLAKLRHESHPGQNDRGVIILDVLPCLACNPDVDEWVDSVANATH